MLAGLSGLDARGGARPGLAGATARASYPEAEVLPPHYELPAPIPPAELSGNDSRMSADDEDRLGLECDQYLSAYDRAQRKIDRQLAGPVPEYSPPASGDLPPPEKQDSAATEGNKPVLRPHLSLAPVSPAAPDSVHSGSLNMTPSPLSPRGDWTNQFADLPSPITTTHPLCSPSIATRRVA